MPEDEDKNQPGAGEEEKGSRMDAAKAFFRAMYAGDEPQGGAPAPEADSRRVKELEQACKDFEQRATEAENLYRRMAADFDNFRRRMERERDEFTNAGVRKLAEAIIPALDDLDRAMMYLTPDTPADKVIESFQLVNSRINQCLEGAGLKRLVTKGEIFDPRFHEPVQQIETTEHADGAIMHELRGGYQLGDRIIRPALVNVALNTVNPAPVTPPPPPLAEIPGKATGEQKMTSSPTDKTTGEQKISSTPQDAVAKAALDEAQSEASKTSAEQSKPKAAATAKKEPSDEGVYDLGNLDDF